MGQFGTSGRNIFPDAGFRNWDFSVGKKFHFGERLNAQFRAEFFNILNHPNFAPPQVGDGNTDIFDGTGTLSSLAGVLVRTTIPERQIQFALKFIF
jgi:hypothetical protein